MCILSCFLCRVCSLYTLYIEKVRHNSQEFLHPHFCNEVPVMGTISRVGEESLPPPPHSTPEDADWTEITSQPIWCQTSLFFPYCTFNQTKLTRIPTGSYLYLIAIVNEGRHPRVARDEGPQRFSYPVSRAYKCKILKFGFSYWIMVPSVGLTFQFPTHFASKTR